MKRPLTTLALSLCLAGGIVTASAVLEPAVAEASLFREASLTHLVSKADVALEGTVVETRSIWEAIPGGGKKIVTYTRVESKRSIFGGDGKDVWVRTLGGRVGNIAQLVEGEAKLAVGTRAILFLKANSEGTFGVVEMAQGHYMVHEDDGPPKLRAMMPVNILLQPKSGVGARKILDNKQLEDAVKIIKAERGVK